MLRTVRTALLAALAILSHHALQAQEDNSTIKLKPTFAVGAGMFAFYGDIGNQHGGYSPLVTRIGYEFRASTPVTDWLEVGLFAVHGKLGANERELGRSLNFESRVTTGGLQLTYNFNQFLNKDHVVEPWVSVGFESVEFLSKTDLYDAQGRMYHYWSDGTIRDIAETAPNAADAVQIQRDYTYESDIRELNLDGFGKYTERTWGVPIGIGAKMKLGGGFDLRIGATMHYTFSDLLDGVTDASLNERAGDAKNDRFLFMSASVSYALKLKQQREPKKDDGYHELSPEEIDALVLNDDEDGDGVTDFKDKSAHTPTGVKVDAFGVPLDGDGDGVPDYMDEEPVTVKGAPVDSKGVAITDDQFLKAYLAFIDSGNVNIVTSRVESLSSPKKQKAAPANKRYYTIQVGSEVEGITEKQMQELLSIPDIRTVEHGDTVSFVVGGYDDLPEAIRRQLQLKSQGVDGKVVAQEGDAISNIDKEVAETKAAMGLLTSPEAAANAHVKNEKTLVRVQLGAFKRKLSRNIFAGINDLVTLHGEDGLTRYYTGVFTDMNEAAKHKVNMLMKGFNGAFLVAFKNGKRVSLREAGAKISGRESLKDVPVSGLNKDLVRFKVQLGAFAGNVPSDIMGKLVEVGDVTHETGEADTKYYHGSFKTHAEASEALKTVQAKGFPDAFVVGDLNGRVISAQDADGILAEP